MRLNQYCHAASELGLSALLSLDGCKGMTESYDECLLDGHCRYCEQYAGVESQLLPTQRRRKELGLTLNKTMLG